MEDIISSIQKNLDAPLDSGHNIKEISTWDNYSLWWTVDHNFLSGLKVYLSTEKKCYKCRRVFFWLFCDIWIYIDLVYSLLIKLLIKLCPPSEITRDKKYKPLILFTSMNRWWGYRFNAPTSHNMKTDLFFDPLFEKLKTKYTLMSTWRIEFNPLREIPTFLDHHMKDDIGFLPLNIYWDISVWKSQKASYIYFKKLFQKIKNNPQFGELCKINDIDCTEYFLYKFMLYFLFVYPYSVKNIQLAKKMFLNINPSLFVLQSEYGWLERAFLIAAHHQHVKTLALQHGEITIDHLNYIFLKNDISKFGIKTTPFCPIPNVTAVYSTYYKELLTTKSGYPQNSVKVTGSPRFDILFSKIDASTYMHLLQKFEIPHDKKIILYATQCHGLSDEENHLNFKTIFSTIQERKDCILLIKQHPREPNRYKKMIKFYQKKYNVPLILINKNENISELLYLCHILITKYSTTGLEAIAMKKPTIILNLGGDPDKVNWVQMGLAVGVYNPKNLNPCIQEIFTNPIKYGKKWEAFMEEQLSYPDGKSTDRVIQLINELVENSND